MFEVFDDVQKIRMHDSHVILVGNKKLIKHVSNGESSPESLETPEMQALIGRAISKKYLTYSTSHG